VAKERQVADPVTEGAESGPAAIERVAEQVLPALIARLTASELGELEVAQNGWRVRLRRDADAVHPSGTPAGGGEHPAGTGRSTSSHVAPGAGSGQAGNTAHRGSVVRRAAASPAVGYFTARDGLATGQAVRSGDVLGVIDVLGVTQPVVAPNDGVIGRILASAGEAVEYGQELIRIDGIERLVES
jgi:biotin carboxyl carrier protein